MWQSELCHAGAMAEDSGMTYEQMLEPGTEGLGQVMAKEELRVPWGGSGSAGLAAILLLWGWVGLSPAGFQGRAHPPGLLDLS